MAEIDDKTVWLSARGVLSRKITNKSRRQQYNCNAIPRHHLISYFVVNETRDDARKS